MASENNPTQITPPRVPFLDERTGAISREWFRFFLSLQMGAQTAIDTSTLPPETSALLASYDALLGELAQNTASNPDANSAAADATAAIADLAQTAGSTQDFGSLIAGLTEALNNYAQALNSAAPAATQDDIAALSSQLMDLQIQPPARQYNNPRYGEFYSSVDQTAAAINTAYAVTFNGTFISSGVSIVSSSQIVVDRPGLYLIQWAVHPNNSSGTAANAWVWMRKNGVDVDYTLIHSTISGSHSESQASARFLISLAPTDYVEVYWATDNTSISLGTDPASAFYPVGPSATVSITDNVSTLESRP